MSYTHYVLRTDSQVYDHFRGKERNKADIEEALLAAGRGNHTEVVKHLLRDLSVPEDLSLIIKNLEKSDKLEDFSCVFEVKWQVLSILFIYYSIKQVLSIMHPQSILELPIAHIAARNGILKLFKVANRTCSTYNSEFVEVVVILRSILSPCVQFSYHNIMLVFCRRSIICLY